MNEEQQKSFKEKECKEIETLINENLNKNLTWKMYTDVVLFGVCETQKESLIEKLKRATKA